MRTRDDVLVSPLIYGAFILAAKYFWGFEGAVLTGIVLLLVTIYGKE